MNVKELVYLGCMLRICISLIISFLATNTFAQIAGHYWTPIPEDYNYCNICIVHHLELNADSTYRAYWRMCLIRHEEYGTYTVNKDTIFFTKQHNNCSYNDRPYEADSIIFRLNEQNIFVTETVKVTKYPVRHNCELLGTNILFYYNHDLYNQKFAGNPFHVSQAPVYTSEQSEKRKWPDLEHSATMLLVKQEYGLY